MVNFSLVTLNGIKFDKDVYEVVLPTADGYIAVFPGHMQLVSLAIPGVISIRHKLGDSDEKLEHFATNGGVIEISDNKVRLLADEADNEADINEKEAEKAYQEAKALAAQAKDQISLDQAQSMIDRQAVRLQVASLRRRKRKL